MTEQPRLIEAIPGSTEIGWTPDGDGLTRDEWVKQVKAAQEIERGILWVIGDLLNWGEDYLADEMFQGYEFHYEPQTIRRARNICRAFPIGKRRENVSIWKHELLAPKHIPEEVKEEILDQANDIVEGGMTMNDIKAELEEREQSPHGKPETLGGDGMFDKTPSCPTCGAENKHWQRTPAELTRDPGTGRPNLRAV